MTSINVKNVRLLEGSFDNAIALLDVHDQPSFSLQVQLSRLRLGARDHLTVYAIHQASGLNYTVTFNPANPKMLDCGAELPKFLTDAKFLTGAVAPLISAIERSHAVWKSHS